MRFLLHFLCRCIENDNDLDLAFCILAADAEMVPETHSIAPRAQGFCFQDLPEYPDRRQDDQSMPGNQGHCYGAVSQRSCEVLRKRLTRLAIIC
jgi:hypothetical protein